MKPANTSSLLRKALEIAPDPISDRELLRQFAAGNEEAFAQLVSRHGAFVLGVCRRALPNMEDAEDVCQAVFVVLAKKAKSASWQPSISNWLYVTARRIASRVNRGTQRRKRREALAATGVQSSPLDEMTGREAFRLLEIELDRLPDKYREPLLLCCLQGLTRDEAASRLGVPLATLKSQLERGRKRLGDALQKRGVLLGLSLLAAFTATPAQALNPQLTETLLLAAQGEASPAALALAKGVSMSGQATKWKAALALFLGVGLFGLSSAGERKPEAEKEPPGAAKAKPEDPKAKPEPEKAEAQPKVKDLVLAGKVLGPDGKPTVAELFLLGNKHLVKSAGKSNEDGTFKVTFSAAEEWNYVVVKKDKCGLDAIPLEAALKKSNFTFNLKEEKLLTGRVINTEGKPIADAEVSLRTAALFTKGELAEHLLGMATGLADQPYFSGERYFGFFWPAGKKWPESDLPLYVRTDKDGRFSIPNLPEHCVVSLWVQAKGCSLKTEEVVHRDGFNPKAINDAMQNRIKQNQGYWLGTLRPLLASGSTIIVEAEKVLRGQVLNADTGKPRAGASVRIDQRDYGHTMPRIEVRTDADGKYELRGLRKQDKYDLMVLNDPKDGVLGRRVDVRNENGFEAQTVNIKVKPGIVIAGQVTNAKTGKGIQSQIHVGIPIANKLAARVPEYAEAEDPCFESVSSDADGNYRVVGVPGQVIVMVTTDQTTESMPAFALYEQRRVDPDYKDYFSDFGYFSLRPGTMTALQGSYTKVLTLEENSKPVTHNVKLQPVTATKFQLKDPDGKPLTGCWVLGYSTSLSEYIHQEEGDTTTIFGLDKIDPKKPMLPGLGGIMPNPGGKPGMMENQKNYETSARRVVIVHPDRKLAATVLFAGKETDPKDEIRLEPMGKLKGKIVDENGKPVAGILVRPSFEDRHHSHMDGDMLRALPDAGAKHRTNADGEFELDNVIPNAVFQLLCTTSPAVYRPTFTTPQDKHTVQSGKTLNLGKIEVKRLKEDSDE